MRAHDDTRPAAASRDQETALVRRPIDPQRLLAAVVDHEAGANVVFLGTARAATGGRPAVALEYEAHEPMAGPELERLCRIAVEKFGLTACAVEHRLGRVTVGEASVAVAASAPHRREAFAAAEWLMERIKREVPIWKCEERPDGRRDWVHPGGDPSKPEAAPRGPRAADRPRTTAVSRPAALVDAFGRVHTDLRISVTDRCNLRCGYCMPAEAVFGPREELLSFDEIARVAAVAAGLGVRTIRLTGGEPLLRRDLTGLVRLLALVPGIDEVAATTNGLLLADQADDLARAGLARLNVSLDTLREDLFERIARRQGLDRVLAGLAAARRAGFREIRVNAVSIRGLTEGEIVPLARFCRREGLHLRFIEFMPLDAEAAWDRSRVLSGADVRAILEREIGPLVAVSEGDPGQPAVDYRWVDGGRVGFINPVTRPFCDRCDRLRLTADGQFRNCLFSTTEWDVKAVLRGGGSDEAIAALLQACVAAKQAAHGIDTPRFVRPARAMYQIGG